MTHWKIPKNTDNIGNYLEDTEKNSEKHWQNWKIMGEHWKTLENHWNVNEDDC